MKKISKLLFLFIFIFYFSIGSVKAASLKDLSDNTFYKMSIEEKKNVIIEIVNDVCLDLGIVNVPDVGFYNNPGQGVRAYNSFPKNTIFVNMAYFNDVSTAINNLVTIDYYLVNTIAHEVRHSYQNEHQNDGTEFGNACKQNYANYIEYGKDPEGNLWQFVEIDARDYGKKYADKKIKNGWFKKNDLNITAIADDGQLFNAANYASRYPDVVTVLGCRPSILLKHYNTYGIKEGRIPN